MHLNLLLSPSSVSVIAWSWGNLSAVAIRAAIAGHENQVKFISEPDHGMYEAINKGIRMATGDVIALMRMGGMSTDSAKRKKVWDEDIRVYSGYGFKPVTLTKLMKMAWKVPQFILQVRPLNDLFVRQRNMNGKSSVNAVLCA